MYRGGRKRRDTDDKKNLIGLLYRLSAVHFIGLLYRLYEITGGSGGPCRKKRIMKKK